MLILSKYTTKELKAELARRENKDKEKIVLRVIGGYKDGGTVHYKGNDNKFYYKDGRRRGKTEGEIFDRYPGDKGAKQLDKENFIIP